MFLRGNRHVAEPPDLVGQGAVFRTAGQLGSGLPVGGAEVPGGHPSPRSQIAAATRAAAQDIIPAGRRSPRRRRSVVAPPLARCRRDRLRRELQREGRRVRASPCRPVIFDVSEVRSQQALLASSTSASARHRPMPSQAGDSWFSSRCASGGGGARRPAARSAGPPQVASPGSSRSPFRSDSSLTAHLSLAPATKTSRPSSGSAYGGQPASPPRTVRAQPARAVRRILPLPAPPTDQRGVTLRDVSVRR